MTQPLTRRQALAGATAVGVGLPVLAACSNGSPTATDTSGPGGADSSTPASSGGGGGTAIASTSDVSVGGATFLENPNVVITQPTEGDFHAFDRTCTHQFCAVQDLQDGKIHCACHNSFFDATTGAPVGGPAPTPLKEFPISVSGDQILPA